jgi:hypothetical protein
MYYGEESWIFVQAALREFHVSPKSLEQPSDSHVRVTPRPNQEFAEDTDGFTQTSGYDAAGSPPARHLRKAVLSVKLSDSTEPSMDVLANPPTVILKFPELQGTPGLPSRLDAGAVVP